MRFRVVYDHIYDAWVIERWRWYWPFWRTIPGLSASSLFRASNKFYARFPGRKLENA